MRRVILGAVVASLAASIATIVVVVLHILLQNPSFFDETDWLREVVELAGRTAIGALILFLVLGVPIGNLLIRVGLGRAVYFAAVGAVLGAVLPAISNAASPGRLLSRALSQEPVPGLWGLLPSDHDLTGFLFWLGLWAVCGACAAYGFWLVVYRAPRVDDATS